MKKMSTYERKTAQRKLDANVVEAESLSQTIMVEQDSTTRFSRPTGSYDKEDFKRQLSLRDVRARRMESGSETGSNRRRAVASGTGSGARAAVRIPMSPREWRAIEEFSARPHYPAGHSQHSHLPHPHHHPAHQRTNAFSMSRTAGKRKVTVEAQDEPPCAPGPRRSVEVVGSGGERSDSSPSSPAPPAPYVRSRRTAVSSEPVSVQSIKSWQAPVYPKSKDEEERLAEVIKTKLIVLFGHLSRENMKQVVNAMFKKEVLKGVALITQGDAGDNFYIVDSGLFEILVSRDGGPPKKVLEAGAGSSFGELALMYNAPRAASCIAKENSVVWALDRTSFRMLLVTAENTKKKRYESLLEKIEIFKCLTRLEKSQLSDLLTVQECVDGECVIRQGERGDRFYIVESGELVCKIRQEDQPELTVHRYHRGGYFGELALIMKYGVRKASVFSVGSTRLLWIGKSTFDRVLGPIIDILRKNASLYPTYAQLLNRTVTRTPSKPSRASTPLKGQ